MNDYDRTKMHLENDPNGYLKSGGLTDDYLRELLDKGYSCYIAKGYNKDMQVEDRFLFLIPLKLDDELVIFLVRVDKGDADIPYDVLIKDFNLVGYIKQCIIEDHTPFTPTENGICFGYWTDDGEPDFDKLCMFDRDVIEFMKDTGELQYKIDLEISLAKYGAVKEAGRFAALWEYAYDTQVKEAA